MTDATVFSNSINQTAAAERTGKMFFAFAAVEILLILVGAVLTFLVAPASLFVSSTETEAFAWILIGSAAFVSFGLGLLLLPLALLAGIAFRHDKSWSKLVGVAAGIVALWQIPVGTVFGIYLLRKILESKRRK